MEKTEDLTSVKNIMKIISPILVKTIGATKVVATLIKNKQLVDVFSSVKIKQNSWLHF